MRTEAVSAKRLNVERLTFNSALHIVVTIDIIVEHKEVHGHGELFVNI